jgi:hypothetical protein
VDGVDTLLPTAHLVAMELVVLVILPNQGTGNEIPLRVCEDTLAQDLTPLREELWSVFWSEHVSSFAPEGLLLEDIGRELLELVADVFEGECGVGR